MQQLLDPSWLLMFGVAVFGFVISALVWTGRLGRDAAWYKRYHDPASPAIYRNAIFGLPVLSTALLVLFAAWILSSRSRAAAIAAIIAAFVIGALSLVIMARTPRWAKPGWLRAEEADPGIDAPRRR